MSQLLNHKVVSDLFLQQGMITFSFLRSILDFVNQATNTTHEVFK